ncbi:DALR anticodon-binding domain-containing protein 3-like [Watersipora subatra]|uniref:DALR anticodon-binding domain-containing protein 3-like n=1 Tax=Watersipora subatra TaxID=2589382 RepID=UPI00355B863A
MLTQNKTFKISKNNKKCFNADYICFYLNKSLDNEKNHQEQQLWQIFQSAGLKPTAIVYDRGHYTVKLDRKQAIAKFIKHFPTTFHAKFDEGSNTGSAFINLVSLSYSNAAGCDWLRQLVFAQHLHNILLRSGVVCSVACGDVTISDLIHKCLHEEPFTYTAPSSELRLRLSTCNHVEVLDDHSWNVQFPETLSIQGNSLNKWRLVEDSGIFRQLCILLSSTKTVCYHILSPSQSYQHQIMLVIFDLLTDGLAEKQQVLEVGSVKLSPPGTLKTLTESRWEYLKKSSEEKYGTAVHEGQFWSERIAELALASLKFELLSRSPKQTASLATDWEKGSDIKIGSFVLYNCSRLATLFKNFEQQVKDGVYPALPALEDVDLSLLKSEDEWGLVFHYVGVYPQLVQELSISVTEEATLCSAQLSQVVKLLHSLSRDLSTYYSRTHILGESRAHLMPTMMARLWLLKLVQRILIDGLSLVSIQAFESM